MKRMKRTKRIFAILFAMIMVVATVVMATGCSKKANKTSSTTAAMVCKATIDAGSHGKLTIEGVNDNGNFALSLSGSLAVEEQSISIDAKDLIVIADEKIYVNLKSLLENAGKIGGESGEMVSQVSSAVDADYVYIKVDGLKSVSSSDAAALDNEYVDLFFNAYKGISAGTDNKLVISLKTEDDIKKFATATIDLIKNNAEKIANDCMKSIADVNIEEMMDKMLDTVVDVMFKVLTEAGMPMQDSMKDVLKSSIKSKVDFTATKIEKDTILKELNEVADKIAEGMEEAKLEEGDGGEFTFEKKDNGCEFDIDVTADGENIKVSASIDNNASASVSAPSNAKNFEDVLSGLSSIIGPLVTEMALKR